MNIQKKKYSVQFINNQTLKSVSTSVKIFSYNYNITWPNQRILDAYSSTEAVAHWVADA